MQTSDDPVIERALKHYFEGWPNAPEPSFWRSGTLEVEGETYVALDNVHGPLAVYRVVCDDFEQVCDWICHERLRDALVRHGVYEPMD